MEDGLDPPSDAAKSFTSATERNCACSVAAEEELASVLNGAGEGSSEEEESAEDEDEEYEKDEGVRHSSM